MLTASHQYAGQNRVGLCSTFGPIASIRFPDDHAWAQLALSQVVGGVETIHIQEAQINRIEQIVQTDNLFYFVLLLK